MRCLSRIPPAVSLLLLALGCSKPTRSEGLANSALAPEAGMAAPTGGNAPLQSIATAPLQSTATAPVELPPECGDGPDVDFHGNAALEAEIHAALGVPPGPLPRSALARLGYLALSDIKLDRLDPCVFPLMTGMRVLLLSSQRALSDLRPLSTMENLLMLEVTDNHVSDITPLAKMTHMDNLDLHGTKVHDVSPLANMTSLSQLNLRGTPVKDISPLAHCTNLKMLNLQDTAVSDLSPLEGMKTLRALNWQGAPIVFVPISLRALFSGPGSVRNEAEPAGGNYQSQPPPQPPRMPPWRAGRGGG